MRGIFKIVVVAGAMSFQAVAFAQIYVCKDASGRTFTSDRYIPECSNRTVRVLDRAGTRRGEIQPPLTDEQKREIHLLDEKRKSEQAALDEQRKNDRALRMRYRNEDDIRQEHERSIGALQEQIRRDKAALAVAEKQMQDMRLEADAFGKKGSPLPIAAQRKLDEAEQSAREQAKAIRGREEEVAALNAKYDRTIKRYREVSLAAK